MADKTPEDVPPIPIPPIVDLAGTGAEPAEKPAPRKKAAPKAVPAAVPPAESVAPVEPAPAVAAPAAAADAPNPYAASSVPPTAPPVAQPNPYAQPAAGQAPQPYAYGPYVPQPPKGLSITSMALGIGGLVFCGTLFLVSLAAVIIGHLAVKRQPYAKGFWLTGIITGYVGILFGIGWLVITLLPIIFAAAYSGYNYGY